MRELISNASDATEKLPYTKSKEIFGTDLDLEIQVTSDAEAGTITISDSGIE